jgi:hypothetical protein
VFRGGCAGFSTVAAHPGVLRNLRPWCGLALPWTADLEREGARVTDDALGRRVRSL